MIEFGGVPLGTVFQGGTMAAVLAMLAIVGRAWIIGIPERLRVANEAKVTAAAELSERYAAWRVEVHDLKNRLAVVAAEQSKCDTQLADARAELRLNESERATTLFLIKQLIRDLERTAPDSIILDQAKATLEHLGHEPFDANKSSALNVAERTVEVAKATVEEAKATVDEVKQAENGDHA